ncbi:MAG: COR domain-containing protein, partial [Rhodothermales bacterium]
PPEIGKLTNLTTLKLKDNPLPIPPETIEKEDQPAAIITYYLEHHVKVTVAEKKPLNEVKMLLVGQGKVGKTSLVKRLLDGRFDLHEGKTEGINITQWNVGVDGQDVQLNVWDFGGQEIMHATHQFFLTKRSLYVLVLDARLGEDENRIEYWLKIIQSFGADSPVIIVGNQIDEHPLDINRAGLQDKYPTIKAFVETSCLTGQGIDDLKAAITREIGALPNIHDELLNTWFTVKTRLEEMKENYISQEKYREMCEAEGITNPLSQRTLLGFLHDLGIILNFRDDPRLEETNILNPEWVTNGVYKILNNRDVFENKGILDRARLKDILDRKQYPPSKHLFIMDMMRKFELCYDLEGRRDEQFLIPDLLPRDEPYTGQWDGALAFEYHYNVLPGSIITRLIVRMHKYIHQHTSWRTGVVLANRDNTALVKADKEDKKIFIRIIGPEAGLRPLLAIIRAQFDAIHDTISRIEADEKVPLPGRPETVVDYEHLLTLEAMGETTFVPSGISERINVKQLLDGVESERDRLKRRASLRGEDKPVLRPEPPPPEPSQPQDAEALAELEKFKTYLDRKSEKETKRRLWAYVGVLVALWIGLVILTFVFGPDAMGV